MKEGGGLTTDAFGVEGSRFRIVTVNGLGGPMVRRGFRRMLTFCRKIIVPG